MFWIYYENGRPHKWWSNNVGHLNIDLKHFFFMIMKFYRKGGQGILSMMECCLFILFISMKSTKLGCFKPRSWSLWKALEEEGCMAFGLVVQKLLNIE
jgi:hypothetical protein